MPAPHPSFHFLLGKRDSVTISTSLGDITIELYWDHAPLTCFNFYQLSKKGYYNGTIFHRIIRDFMIQGGDPSGSGRGGECCFSNMNAVSNQNQEDIIPPSFYNKKRFEDEIHSNLKHIGAGILSMANSGPNTNGSQFFITLAPCQHLDGKHAIFGRVQKGMGVVKRLGEVRTDGSDRPVEEVRILRTFCNEVERVNGPGMENKTQSSIKGAKDNEEKGKGKGKKNNRNVDPLMGFGGGRR